MSDEVIGIDVTDILDSLIPRRLQEPTSTLFTTKAVREFLERLADQTKQLEAAERENGRKLVHRMQLQHTDRGWKIELESFHNVFNTALPEPTPEDIARAFGKDDE